MMKFFRSLLILALATFAFGGPACAQGHPQASSDNTSHLMQSYRQKTGQLQVIQQKAVKNTPQLAGEMKQFQLEVNTSMRAHGYDVAKGQQDAEAMAAKLKSSKKMSKAERMSTMKSFGAERQKMMNARAAAMHEPKIQKDGKALRDDMIAAMKKQDGHTGQLLKDVKSLRTRIIASMAAHRATPKNNG
jgi:hypothetical protein